MTSTHTHPLDFPALTHGTVVERADGFRYVKIGASTWQLLDANGDYAPPTRYDDSQMTYSVERNGATFRIVLEPGHVYTVFLQTEGTPTSSVVVLETTDKAAADRLTDSLFKSLSAERVSNVAVKMRTVWGSK